MKQGVQNVVKGAAIGASLLVPGVSGGTMAIILGIYDKLIAAVGNLFKEPKKNLLLLGTVSLGGIAGVLLFAKLLLYVTTTYEMPMMFLFLGAVVGSLPMLFGKAQIRRFSPKVLLYPAIGLALVLSLELLPPDLLQIELGRNPLSYLVLVVAGIILAVALVLPGISVSYMLLIMGIYQQTLTAIEQLNLPFLFILGISVLIGVFLTTKLLERAMTRRSQETFLLIIGFVIGSLRDVFPGFPSGWEIPLCLATFCAGFGAILFLSRFSD